MRHPPIRTLLFLLVTLAAGAGWGNETEWLDQFGTVGYDGPTAIVRHSTGLYVTGRQAALPWQYQDSDAVTSGFVRKYDLSGNLLWVRQFAFGIYGTEPFAMAVDDRGVYLAGRWEGESDGGAFVRKFSHSGSGAWTHFFAPKDQGPWMSEVWAIEADATGIYVAGDGFVLGWGYNNALVSRLDFAGNELWTRVAATKFKHPWGYDQDASATGIAVDATGIYVSGVLGTADVQRYDPNGNLTATFGTGTLWGGGLALDDSGIYLAGTPCPPQCQFAISLRKYDRNGAELWTRELPTGVYLGGVLALEGSGLFLTGAVQPDYPEGPTNALVHKYDVDGRLVWTDEFGAAAGNDIAADPTGVYVAGVTSGFPGGSITSDESSFVIKRNEKAAPKVQLISLGDINGDGKPDLAALGHDRRGNLNWVVVKDARTSSTIRKFAVADEKPAAAISPLPDLDGIGAPEIAILSASTRQAEVHDSLTGALLSRVAFDPSFAPMRLASLPDQNANGLAELALLHQKEGTARVEIRDPLSDTFVRTIAFASPTLFGPKDLAVLSDINGNGVVELAVLQRSAVAAQPDRVEVRDAETGELIRVVGIGTGGALLQLLAVPDVSGNGMPEFAVLRKGSAQVVLKDARSGETVSVLAYTAAHLPLKMALLPDFSGNGIPEIALLQARWSEGTVRAVVKDTATGQWLGATYFGSTVLVRPDDVAVVPDLNNNGMPEIARLGVRGIDGAAVVSIRDVRAGAIVGQRTYYP